MSADLHAVLARVREMLANDPESLAADVLHYLYQMQGRTIHDDEVFLFSALALAVRDRIMPHWHETWRRLKAQPTRRAFYLSMEYLIGRSLQNFALNLELERPIAEALELIGKSFEAIEARERDAALGNGGLGRLAACFLDSAATLGLPLMGYGLRYEYGMFRQVIRQGYQVEEPERWLRQPPFPWEIERPENTQRVHFGGHTHHYTDPETGRYIVHWDYETTVLAVPYDVPVPGYRNGVVNTLRLWSAQAPHEFNLGKFNEGDYFQAVDERIEAESITLVLYPNDASVSGKELRLKQQYFLVSASIQDVMAFWLREHGPDWSRFAEYHVFQLNDTHPALAVVELLRLLLDEQHLDWDTAWGIVTATMAYTNHTLMPEALEEWPVAMFQRLLPRHYELIVEIDRRLQLEVQLFWPDQPWRHDAMAIVRDKRVRMAHLAVHASFSVNGVSQIHTDLLTQLLFPSHAEMTPEKFNNKTNGVTPRRWLAACNPGLRALLDDALGPQWVLRLEELARLESFAQDAAFQERWREVKRGNKARLAQVIAAETGVRLDAQMLFDVQAKRIHEYKRQLLNALHVIHLYDRIKQGDTADWLPRAVIFAGKAAPGYAFAKLIIKFLNNVAEVVNRDPATRDKLRVVFWPNYRVTAMELLAPAADLSEQISTASTEASGTGNMKLMMNGALTLGTRDGANVEIFAAVGEAHAFAFGLNAEEVLALRSHYRPEEIIARDEALQRVLGLIERNHFSYFEPGLFQPILDKLRSPHDPWLVLADFAAFVAAQRRAEAHYRNPRAWWESSIRNTAASAPFSSDRTIAEYNAEIWRLPCIASVGEAR